MEEIRIIQKTELTFLQIQLEQIIFISYPTIKLLEVQETKRTIRFGDE